MNLALLIARRYLFSKKSVNAINIISGIAVFGLSIGTAALVLVLSVFNGFEDLITGLFSNFNPDVKIEVIKGKTFVPDSTKIAQIKSLDGVLYVSETLEEVAIFEYKGNQDYGILKGVDADFEKVTEIDSTLREGVYRFQEGEQELAVLGVGMRNKLSVNVNDVFSSITVYMAKRKKVGPMSEPFRKRFVYPVGTFNIQQDFDSQYVLCSIDFIRGLLKYKKEVSALEIKLNKAVDETQTLEAIETIMGDDFIVKNRYRQDEAFLKLMNIEKWMSFAILSLTLLLVAFNMVGCLWMIVLEKQKDIAILKSMGASNTLVRNIFLGEGLLLSLLGICSGFLLAILLYIAQKNLGLVPIPEGFVIDSYPISMRIGDFIVVGVTVIFIGLLASIPPAIRAQRVDALIRES